MKTLRDKAIAFGAAAAAKQFAGRKGHGGNPCLAERHLSRNELAALLAAAFEAGANLAYPKRRWYVGQVKRPNAGGPLYNAVYIENNKDVEADVTPTHSEQLAQKLVDELNAKEIA